MTNTQVVGKNNFPNSVQVAAITFLTLMSSLSAFAVSDQELVDQFYPEQLTAQAAKFKKRKLPRQSTFVLADLDNVGTQNYIVAAYSNSIAGDIRVLKKSGQTANLVSDPRLPAMTGFEPQVSLADLDGDKKPEVLVSFSSARGVEMNWYFKWQNSQLQIIGPTARDDFGRIVTTVTNGSLADLNGDGTLSIIDGPSESRPSPGEDVDKPVPYQTYSLVNGKYVTSSSLLFSASFTRQAGPPETKTETFNVDRTDTPYVLRVVNGKSDGTGRVSSGEISLNGKLVVGSDKFNQKVTAFTVPVGVNSTNQLAVTLKSSPGSHILVTVESKR